MTPLDDNIIIDEWNGLEKEWSQIYRWERVTGLAYTEQIANLIFEDLNIIELNIDNLRSEGFHIEDHNGQISQDAPRGEFNEKRFCRALYNRYNREPHENFGLIVDYEVPFNVIQSAGHGDIDLLSISDGEIYINEVKQPASGESLLKAILEVFVYCKFVNLARTQFLMDFEFEENCVITPTIITFSTAATGRQLDEYSYDSNLHKLIMALNLELGNENINSIQFFVINNDANLVEDSLVEIPLQDNEGLRIEFDPDFQFQSQLINLP